MKIALGVPHLNDLPGYFVDSVLSLSRPADTLFIRMEGKPVDVARNRIVERFLEHKDATHLFFMDSDMTFHPATLARLMRHDLPVVSGTYFARTDTPVPHVYQYHHEDEDGVGWFRAMAQEFREWLAAHPEQAEAPSAFCFPESDLVEADGVGGGCLLIKREVLEAVGGPHWFESYDTGGGEDFDFCHKAKLAGYKVMADWGIQCNHGTTGVFTGREEFVECFADVDDMSGPILVEVGPNGRKRFKRPGPQLVVQK